MPEQPRIFISYARKDGEKFATTLRERLEHEHPELTVWQDRVRMEGGIGWWKQIEDALAVVKFIVLVMTPSAIQSPIARKEWRYARQQGVAVCPVKGASDGELDFASLPRWMSKTHFYDINREWDTFIRYLQNPPPWVRVPFMAPDLPEGFVQRPAVSLELVGRILDRERKNPVAITTALQGAGGLGKTTLAAALCHDEDIVTSFDDGILWATLGETPNVLGALTKVYAALTGERPGFVDIEDASLNLAQKLEDKNCLVVIDDVWDAAHLRPFLRGAAKCTRLITTRKFDLTGEAEQVVVDVMASQEAVELLTKGLEPIPNDLSHLRDLAKRLGGWPLLLELAAATLRNRLRSGDNLHGALGYLNRKLDKQGVIAFDQRDANERHQAFAKTIEISLEVLTWEERERCHALAVFPRMSWSRSVSCEDCGIRMTLKRKS
jgi:hypothetical protein